MRKRVPALLLIAVIVAGCSSTGRSTLRLEDVAGLWVLDAFGAGGSRQQVEVGVNTASIPWMEVGEGISGMSGCNGFSVEGFGFESGVLIPGEWFSELAGCLSKEPARDLMTAENAFRSVLRQKAIKVGIQGSTMTWRAVDITLFFERADAPPEG